MSSKIEIDDASWCTIRQNLAEKIVLLEVQRIGVLAMQAVDIHGDSVMDECYNMAEWMLFRYVTASEDLEMFKEMIQERKESKELEGAPSDKTKFN